MDDLAGDEKWLLHLTMCGFSSEQAASIMSLSVDLLKWEEAGGSEHSFAIVCEAHHNTWFTTEGLKSAVVFLQGVAAGTPLADVLFLIGAAVVFGSMESQLRNSDLRCSLDASGATDFWNSDLSDAIDEGEQVVFSQVSYVDDLGAPGFCTAHVILQTLADKSAIIFNALASFLLEMNLSAGKSEIRCVWWAQVLRLPRSSSLRTTCLSLSCPAAAFSTFALSTSTPTLEYRLRQDATLRRRSITGRNLVYMLSGPSPANVSVKKRSSCKKR